MVRSTAQVIFSELYMERSSRRSGFFKMLNTQSTGKWMEKKNKKIY
ncbi:MAG: hypothetical protein ACMUEL_07690 [Flavobacteriales bacterium Tduv]